MTFEEFWKENYEKEFGTSEPYYGIASYAFEKGQENCNCVYTDVIQKLEKENAKLKEDNDARKFAMAMSEKVEKQLREENTKLKKEVLEVRQHLELTEREWGKDTTKSIYFKTQLTKAKDIIKELVKGIRITFEHRGFITNVDAFLLKAEQFLKEVEK